MRGKPLEFWFIPVSAAAVATGAFVVSQVGMIIAADGHLSFWGFALMGSALLSVVEWIAVFLAGLLVFAVALLAGGARRRWALIAGSVCGLAAGSTAFGLLVLGGGSEDWWFAALSVPVAAAVTAVSAYFLRLPDRIWDPQPPQPPVKL